MISMHTSLFQTSRMYRWSVVFTITCVVLLSTLVVYGILLIRPDRIAEKRDVDIARSALEARLKAEDKKRDAEHEEAMTRIKRMTKQQEVNINEIRRLKAKLGE